MPQGAAVPPQKWLKIPNLPPEKLRMGGGDFTSSLLCPKPPRWIWDGFGSGGKSGIPNPARGKWGGLEGGISQILRKNVEFRVFFSSIPVKNRGFSPQIPRKSRCFGFSPLVSWKKTRVLQFLGKTGSWGFVLSLKLPKISHFQPKIPSSVGIPR